MSVLIFSVDVSSGGQFGGSGVSSLFGHLQDLLPWSSVSSVQVLVLKIKLHCSCIPFFV